MTLDESLAMIIMFAPMIVLTFIMVPMILLDLISMFFDWVIDCAKDFKIFVVTQRTMKKRRPPKIKITNRHYDLYKPKSSKEPQNVGGPTAPVMIKF